MASIEDNVSDTRGLENATNTIIQQFSQFEANLIHNSNEVAKRIVEVDAQHLKFKEFVSESIIQSSKISKYAQDFTFFTRCCANNEFPEDDLLQLLRQLLNDADENKKEVEKLQLKIRNIIDSLTNTNNKLVIHSKDFKENHRLLDSETKKKLIEKETDKKQCIKSVKKNLSTIFISISVSIISIFISRDKAMATSTALTVCPNGLMAMGKALTTYKAIRQANSEIANLEKSLSEERDQLINDIQKLNGDFIAIIDNCREFLNFWQNKTNEIKDIIEKLKRFDDEKGEFRNDVMISGNLFEKWQRMNGSCEEYNNLVLPLLGNDRLLKIE